MNLTPEQVERWGDLINRLEREARDGSHSVISVDILTDELGAPLLWILANKTRYEPKSGAVQFFEVVAAKQNTVKIVKRSPNRFPRSAD